MLLETLQSWDRQLFLYINKEWESPFFDQFFLILTNLTSFDWFRYGVLPLILVLWFWQSRQKMLRAFLALVITVAVADAIGYRLLKPNIDRARPNHIEELDANVKMGGYGPRSGSFPSNHAMNTFAVASVLAWFYPPVSGAFFLLAGLTAYSRVYAGVHFPSDVIGGAMIGLFVAFLLRYLLFSRFAVLRPAGRNE